MIIGICGGSGSGKSFACSILSTYGYPIIDADNIYHVLISSHTDCTKEIFDRFGQAVFNSDGVPDRALLAKVVFNDKTALADLNAITHRHVLSEMERLIEVYNQEGRNTVVCDVPLLFESGFNKKCDVTIAVVADYDKRVARIIARDKITTDAAMLRISKQISDCELVEKCDFTVYNNTDECDLKKQLDLIIDKIL